MGAAGAFGVPCMNLQVSISIPIQDLLQTLVRLGGQWPQSPSPSFPSQPGPVRATADGLPVPTAGAWEKVPTPLVTGPPSVQVADQHVVQVTRMPRGVSPAQIKQVFEKQVGPVVDCSIEKGVASLHFSTGADAQRAVAFYDGGILEVQSDQEHQALEGKNNVRQIYQKTIADLPSNHMIEGCL